MQIVQDLVHKLEVGGGARVLRISIGVMAVIAMTVLYHMAKTTNTLARDAMDAAQVGRNLAEGRGYTTYCIRALSMHLVAQRHQVIPGTLGTAASSDPYQIKEAHPDLANAPVYPVILAGIQKLSKLGPPAQIRGNSWTPDLWIVWFNQLLLFGLIVMVFFLAKRLFEPRVAWLTTFVMFISEPLWRAAVLGVSNLVLLLETMALIWVLVGVEKECREGGRSGRLVWLAIAAGVLVGLGGLTRYSYAWMILPVVLFLVFCGGSQRVFLGPVAFGVFAVVLLPWIIRNFAVSGTPFGTAGFFLFDGRPGDIERWLNPDSSGRTLTFFATRLLSSLPLLLIRDLPQAGGPWLSAFFFVGLLIACPDVSTRRLRYFIVGSLLLLTATQGLGSAIGTQNPEQELDNLFIVFLPLVVMYGVSFFFVVLDQMDLPVRELRYAVIAILCVATGLPIIFQTVTGLRMMTASQQSNATLASIRELNNWVRPGELIMSDIPEHVSWYADRPCIGTTMGGIADFIEINDYYKPIQELFFFRGVSSGWSSFKQNMARSKDHPRPASAANEEEKPIGIGVDIPLLEPSGTTAMFPLHFVQSRRYPLQGELLLTAREHSIR